MAGSGRDAACPACLGTRIGSGAERGEYRFDECRDCGYLFLNPRPAQSALDALYREEATAAEPTFDKAAGISTT